MKHLYDEKGNPLTDFLFQSNGKKRIRRKYIEWILLDYSVTQAFNSDTIYIRKRREIKEKYRLVPTNPALTRKYDITYSCRGSDQGLKYLKYYLERDNKLELVLNKRRKLKIKKLLRNVL